MVPRVGYYDHRFLYPFGIDFVAFPDSKFVVRSESVLLAEMVEQNSGILELV